MRRLLPLLTCCAAVSLAAPVSATAQDAKPFAELARRVPAGANALFVADIGRIINSQQAKDEQWGISLASLYTSGMTNIPPNTRRMLVATELDLEFMHPLWEVALLEASKPAPALEAIAKKQGGRLESLAGRPAIGFHSDAFLVHFDGRQYGAFAPANRQRAARWVRQVDSQGSTQLSPYLQEAIDFVQRGTAGSVIAIDMTDIISVAEAKERMENSQAPFIKGQNLPVDEISQVLASLRGLKLGATFKDKTYAKLHLDFAREVGPAGPIAKPLLLKLLGDNGVLIDEFKDWTSTVDGKRVVLEGVLTKSGRRRLMSLVVVPASPTTLNTLQAGDGQQDDPQQGKGYASSQYFHAIQMLLDDLKRDRREAKTMGLIGVWLDKYARKIDRLPLSGVDPELMDYGQFVSSHLREASMAIKGIGIQSRARALQEGEQRVTDAVVGGYSSGYSPYRWGRYGSYGWYGVYSRGQDAYERKRVANRVRGEERAKGATEAMQLMTEVDNATATVRKKMAQKYDNF